MKISHKRGLLSYKAKIIRENAIGFYLTSSTTENLKKQIRVKEKKTKHNTVKDDIGQWQMNTFYR